MPFVLVGLRSAFLHVYATIHCYQVYGFIQVFVGQKLPEIQVVAAPNNDW